MPELSPKAISYLRFSTPDQLKGDSFRRQTELSRQYADRHGLDLDETLSFQDLGVSAFRGRNINEGALGAFLEAVDSGRVPKGTFLLVENLDRLSRDTVQQAFRRFSEILERGVNVVTLADGKVYTQDSLNQNFSDLLISLTTMFRAHEESLLKSRRLKEAWKAKRDNARSGGRKLTGRCPGWLRLISQEAGFEIIEDRAAVVQRVFEMTLDGIGKEAIARKLNAEQVPTFGRSAGWYPSYVQKILGTEAVTGMYQPMRTEIGADGVKRRCVDGPPIEDYFPAVVPKEKYFRARQMRRERSIGAGRKGQSFSNLLQGIARCGACGSTMNYVNKGRRETYLVCSAAKRGVGGCKYVSWRYGNAEKFLLVALNEVRYEEILPSFAETSTAALSRLEDDLAVARAAVERVESNLDSVLSLLIDRPDSRALKTRLDELEDTRDSLHGSIQSLERRHQEQKALAANAVRDHTEALDALAAWLREAAPTPEVAFERRSRLHQLLKKVVDQVTFAPPQGNPERAIRVAFKGAEGVEKEIRVRGRGQGSAKCYNVIRGVIEKQPYRVIELVREERN